MPQVRKYSLKARLMRGTSLIGYSLQTPEGIRQEVDVATAVSLARQGLINHVKATSDNKLVGNGIRISNLPTKQR